MEMKELATLALGGDRIWKIVNREAVGALYTIYYLPTPARQRPGCKGFRAMVLKRVLVEMGRLENAMKKRSVKTRVSFLKFVGRLVLKDESSYQNPAANRIGSFFHGVGTSGDDGFS